MSIPWEKVVTDPLGLAGYALFLVFGVATIVVKQRKPGNRWLVPAGFALAAISVLACLGLAYRNQPVAPIVAAPQANTPPPTQSLHIDKVDQKANNGNAVAGVQGNVTITSNPPPQASKPRR